ncbi:MAG: tetratricopeptide repeat protein [Reyranellaceae bacterium]
MADIFQEVEEDVRREKAARLWKRFAPLVIGLAVAIVLAVAAVTGWRQYVASERAKSSDRYSAAIDLAAGGDRTAAIEQLAALARDAREPYATLARLRQAGLMSEAGDKAAGAVFAEAAEKTDDPLLADYARLMEVVQSIGSEDAKSVIARLEPMAAEGKPWRSLANDYIAFLAYDSGDVARARAVWEQIVKDERAAPTQKQRANELLAATSAAAGESKGKE